MKFFIYLLSVISNHRLEHKHEFNWEDIKILDIEPSYQKRIISKVYIKKQSRSLNKQSNTELLFDDYLCILNLIFSV